MKLTATIAAVWLALCAIALAAHPHHRRAAPEPLGPITAGQQGSGAPQGSQAQHDVVTIRIPPSESVPDQAQQQYDSLDLEDADRYAGENNDMQRQLVTVGGVQADLQRQLVTISGVQADMQRQLVTVGLVQAGVYAIQAALLAFILLVGVRQVGIMRRICSSTYRPVIRVKHLWLTGEIQPNVPVSASLVIANVGEAMALIRNCEVTGLVVPMEATLPAKPHFPEGPLEVARAGNRGHVDPGLTLEIPCPDVIDHLTDTDYAQLMANQALLTCYGSIEYLDQEQRARTINFCRCLRFYHGASNQPIGRFSLVNDPDYEYQE